MRLKLAKVVLLVSFAAGFYHSPGWNRDYPRVQILTIEQLLKDAQVQMPPTAQTFKQALEAGKGQEDQEGFEF